MLDDALAVLLHDRLAPIVELVLCRRDGFVEAHTRRGSTAFAGDGSVVWVRGDDPFARSDPGAFAPLELEVARIRPDPDANHYPFAHTNVAHLFDDPRAPDLAVVHTAAHHWAERGGHLGEHGSLDVVQSRAPLLMAGAGVRTGLIPGAARMVDIAPTVAALLGMEHPPGDGRVLTEALTGERARRVVVFLWDGTNANVLHAMTEAGDLPAVASLAARGLRFEHGLVASFPSVTLANHTTAVTGVHPGHHGVLHNYYYDRAAGRSIVTNAPEAWHLARDEIRREVATLFESAARAGLGPTAAVNEPADRGATAATFDALRRGEVADVGSALGDPADVPGATEAFVRADIRYGWSSAADVLAVQQATTLLAGAQGAVPRLLWINLILPDAAAHIGGPYSDMARAGLRDTDARMGQILRGVEDDPGTAVLLIADHGMEESDPDCTGDWKPGLTAAGIRFVDEGEGFIYLDP